MARGCLRFTALLTSLIPVGREDPIPWVYGMDCTNGLYYTYEGTLYLCKSDMKPCVWAPGSPGLWQWEAVS